MTPLAIAHTRPTGDPDAFLMAFTAATQAGRWDLDLEAMIRHALQTEQYAKTAGLLEGIAAVHAEAGMPIHPAPDWHRHRNARGRFTDPRAICPECHGPLHDGPCPQTHHAHQPTTPAGGRNAGEQLAAYKAAVERALELIETSPEAFLSTTSNNLRAAAGVLHEAHDTPGAPA